jgi:hypothetical protein
MFYNALYKSSPMMLMRHANGRRMAGDAMQWHIIDAASRQPK